MIGVLLGIALVFVIGYLVEEIGWEGVLTLVGMLVAALWVIDLLTW